MSESKNSELLQGWRLFEKERPDWDMPVFVSDGKDVRCALRHYEDEGWYWVQLHFGSDITDPDNYEDADDYEFKYWHPMLKAPEALLTL